MKYLVRVAVLVAVCAGFLGGFTREARGSAADRNTDASRELREELARIADASGGTLGVSALHVESGRRIHFNATQRFPMASTFKVAVAMKVLDQVDRGALSLSQAIEVDGDNVSRTAAQVVSDAWGFKLPPAGQRDQRTLGRLQNSVPAEAQAKSRARFLEDARDTTTPEAMVALLERLHRGKARSPASTELLLDHMEHCRTGARRLKGELPRGTTVAHKTGTLTRVATNDVGIVTLPWKGGHVIVAIYLKGSVQPLAQQERSVALASKSVYEHFIR